MRQFDAIIDPMQMIHGMDNSEKRIILRVQTKALGVMTNELVLKGFNWILPVILAKPTDPLWPDPGASIV